MRILRARNFRHAAHRQLIIVVRVIDYDAVAVNQKSVTVFRVTFAQNLSESVEIKIYPEDAQKFIFIVVNRLRECHAIQTGLSVVIRCRNAEAVLGFFRVDIPRASFGTEIRRRYPAVVHYDFVSFVRIRHVTNRNFFVIFRQPVQKSYCTLVIVHQFGVFAYQIYEHAQDTALFFNPVR